MENKRILLKSLRLEKYFKAYRENEPQKQQTYEKFEQVWGTTLADHFLSKYNDAESLIWALDSENLALFVRDF